MTAAIFDFTAMEATEPTVPEANHPVYTDFSVVGHTYEGRADDTITFDGLAVDPNNPNSPTGRTDGVFTVVLPSIPIGAIKEFSGFKSETEVIEFSPDQDAPWTTESAESGGQRSGGTYDDDDDNGGVWIPPIVFGHHHDDLL